MADTTTHPGRDDTTPMASRPRRIRNTLIAVVCAVALVGAGLALGAAGYPDDSSPEAGFARDMKTHHAQAVQMAMIVRDRTDDPEIRILAYDIALSQQQQIGQMAAWLDIWGLPQTSGRPPMTWMDDGGSSHHGGRMPGMASPAQLRQLEKASGRDAEVLFLELMIPHHKAGVDMAAAVLQRTTNAQVRRMAETIKVGQQAEIEQMQTMLRARTASQDN